jgi:hypothetical protein
MRSAAATGLSAAPQHVGLLSLSGRLGGAGDLAVAEAPPMLTQEQRLARMRTAPTYFRLSQELALEHQGSQVSVRLSVCLSGPREAPSATGHWVACITEIRYI